MIKKQNYLSLGAAMLAKGIMLGALAAHSLEKKLSMHYLDVWKTASSYFLYHGIAFMVVGIFAIFKMEKCCTFRGIHLAFIGICVFSISLWILSLNEILNPSLKMLGMITPIGGVLMIIGWLLFAVDSYKSLKSDIK